MSDYVTRLFREALGRLEGEYRSEGLAKLARKSAARNAPEPDMGTGTVADRHR